MLCIILRSLIRNVNKRSLKILTLLFASFSSFFQIEIFDFVYGMYVICINFVILHNEFLERQPSLENIAINMDNVYEKVMIFIDL